MFWCANTVQPAYRAWFYAHEMAGPDSAGATREMARERLQAAWQRLSDHLYVVDPLGNWMMRFPAPLDPKQAKRDLDRLLRASSSWDKEGRPAN